MDSHPKSNASPDEQIARQRVERLLGNAVWLVRLRWVAIVGQFLTIGVAVLLLRVQLELTPLLSIVILTAITNFGFTIWLAQHLRQKAASSGQRLEYVIVALMILDLISLTGLLYFSGGPDNPFVVFYFVNLALGAVLLPAHRGWTLMTATIVCLMVLFAFPQPMDDLKGTVKLGGRSISLQRGGLLVALIACSVVVVNFVTRVTRELRKRERELRAAEQLRAKSQRMESLGTLAAGAGHELATPLSTIAVVTKELTRHLEGVDVPDTVLEDVALIRSEVDRCRTILERMSGSLARNRDEASARVTIEKLVDEVLDGLSDGGRVHTDIPKHARERSMMIPLQSAAQAIRGVVQNAIDASAPGDSVELSAWIDKDAAFLRIRDHGPGMPSEVLARAGEPFFTTKEPGKGMGLGLFLTRSVIERLHGTLHLQSSEGCGVTATIQIPLDT